MDKNNANPPTEPSSILPTPYLEPTPDHFLPAPKVPPTGFERAPQPGSWRAPVLMALGMVAVSTAHWGSTAPLGYAVAPKHLHDREHWWRFLSALFAHGDFDHLAHNLPPFLLFAWLLHGYFGGLAFPWLGLIAGVGANFVTVYSYGSSSDGPSALLGASGMVYGLVGIWLVLYMAFELKKTLKQRILRVIGFGLALFFPKTFEPRVSYLAHLSGFLLGATLAFLFIPWFRRFSPMLSSAADQTKVQFPVTPLQNPSVKTDGSDAKGEHL